MPFAVLPRLVQTPTIVISSSYSFDGERPLCRTSRTARPVRVGHMSTSESGLGSGQDVLDVDVDVIQGLYATGEVTGGFHGAAYMTGASLGKGAVFGRITAWHAASSAS
jgi:succinate dehydrogenase/fumarate reductase flavoprotein subunit